MLVSIITVCYNELEGIRKTIESVISQSYNNLEYIIIDGGSSDGSINIIHEYSEKINIIVTEPDNGIYDAMNKGIALSKGDYIMFVNGGDSLPNNEVLSQMVKYLTPNTGVLYGIIAKPDGTICYDLGKFRLLNLLNQSIPHQSTLINRKLFNEFGLYNCIYKIAADFEFFLRIVLYSHLEVKYIPIIVSLFDQNGVSRTNSRLKNNERERIWNEYPSLKKELTKLLQLELQVSSFKQSRIWKIISHLIPKRFTYIK